MASSYDFWQAGLAEYDAFNGLDWAWMSTDGAMTKAPLAGEKTGPSPVDRSKSGTKRSLCVEGGGVPVALSVAGANRNDFKLLEQTLQSFAQAKPKPTRAKPPAHAPGQRLRLRGGACHLAGPRPDRPHPLRGARKPRTRKGDLARRLAAGWVERTTAG